MQRDLLAAIGPRVRTSPFFDRTVALGLQSVSCYNHMWLPMSYGDPDLEYRRLTQGVTIWDVAAQRHIEVRGADADAAVQAVTVVDTHRLPIGAGSYAPMVDHDGQLVNDPILLHTGDSAWRFSIADGDMRLWIDATARARGLDCTVRELDTATLAVQGPDADAVTTELGLGGTTELEPLHFVEARVGGVPVKVCNSGWSNQGGVEIFVDEPGRAGVVWDSVWDAGTELDIGPGAPNPSERIENVLLSYGTDTGYHADPFELGLGDLVADEVDFVGSDALRRLRADGPRRRLRGVRLDGERMETLARPHPATVDGRPVGDLRAAAWSPRFGQNIGLALLDASVEPGSTVGIRDHEKVHQGTVVALPFT